MALMATVHWLFDRYLLSITDDFKLLKAEHRIPREIEALLDRNSGKINLPLRPADWPHLVYLKKHRDIFLAINGTVS
jgi:putative restriction endonuclease